MKNFSVIFSLCIFITGRSQSPVNPLPSSKQLAWQNAPFYLFMHFGPNTFTDLEWGKGSEKEELFNPTAMDCRQWCRIAKAAGATGIVLTAKHHDGFCLWPSAFSKHTVAQSKWRNGKGDVLKELSSACREYGLSFGVYLSPWDRNHPEYGTPGYNDVFTNMMNEVVAHYGPLFEFWWDGANGEGPNGKKQVYDWHRFETTMRKIAPNTMVFSDIGPDIRWVGNEDGVVGSTNWNLLDTAGFSRGLGAPPNDTLNQGNINGKNWLPAECDVSIRPGWFYHFKEDSLVKSPEKLFDIYLKSVGRGANLILNVPPDPSGLISSYDSAALMKFAQLRNESFQDLLNKDQSVIYLHGEKIKELSKGKDGVINLGKNFKDEFLEIRFNKELAVNCILLKELLQWGQRIKSFEIEVYDNDSLLYKNAYTTMGHQRIISFPTRNSNRILIRITGAKSDPILGELSVYHIPEMLVEK
ncbi:MAG TPA: alpha-L-fucosidase [Puia sp.]|jgi:alpha-L-fucosidase|nr:alpha-L-fucosidase [Puia sp.]